MVDVAVVGAGYVGLGLAACLVDVGHSVFCLDTDARRVEMLRGGTVPMREPGLPELLSSGLESGRLRFTTEVAEAIGGAEAVFLCVPTPQGPQGAADLSFLRAAAASIRDHLAPGAVVVVKSTAPVGTAAQVLGWIGRDDVDVVSNPEFLREGSVVADFYSPSRIVIGAWSAAAGDRIEAVYPPGALVVRTDPASAELIKTASNTYLAMRLSFVNEVSAMCAATGATLADVLAGLGGDRRIGPEFLHPGPGWGGSCFPKDVRSFAHTQGELGLDNQLATAVHRSNAEHIARVVAHVVDATGGPQGTVAVWGLTFKAGTDDLRESPALAVVAGLVEAGCRVRAYDPEVAEHRDLVPAVVELAPSALDACDGADALVVLTEWSEFAMVEPTEAVARLRRARVYDTRLVLRAAAWEEAGGVITSIGTDRVPSAPLSGSR